MVLVQVMSKLKLSPLFKLRDFIFNEFYVRRKYTLGRVLTIIDASIADPQQRKGIKDLIEQSYWDEPREINKVIKEGLLEFADKYCPDLLPKSVSEVNQFKGLYIPKKGLYIPKQEEIPSPGYFDDK